MRLVGNVVRTRGRITYREDELGAVETTTDVTYIYPVVRAAAGSDDAACTVVCPEVDPYDRSTSTDPRMREAGDERCGTHADMSRCPRPCIGSSQFLSAQGVCCDSDAACHVRFLTLFVTVCRFVRRAVPASPVMNSLPAARFSRRVRDPKACFEGARGAGALPPLRAPGLCRARRPTLHRRFRTMVRSYGKDRGLVRFVPCAGIPK